MIPAITIKSQWVTKMHVATKKVCIYIKRLITYLSTFLYNQGETFYKSAILKSYFI
jgi:hypothetical protein